VRIKYFTARYAKDVKGRPGSKKNRLLTFQATTFQGNPTITIDFGAVVAKG